MNDEDDLLEPISDDEVAIFMALFDLRCAVGVLMRDLETLPETFNADPRGTRTNS